MAEDKPRYSRVSDILDLAVFMSSRIQGITITDIIIIGHVKLITPCKVLDNGFNIISLFFLI